LKPIGNNISLSPWLGIVNNVGRNIECPVSTPESFTVLVHVFA
jgi:hypothetical protein